MPAVESRKLLTPQQVADLLGVDQQTLANWRCTGRHNLPFLRIGRKIMYRADHIERWMESRTVGAISQDND